MSSSTSPVSEAKITLTPAACDDRLRGERDPLQREDDEAEADQDAAEAADVVACRREEEHDADEDQERREPRQVERQDHRDERGADVGAEHHRERRAPCRSGPGPRTRRRSARSRCCSGSAPVTPSPAKNAAKRLVDAAGAAARRKVRAVEAQDAGAHDVRAPDEQRDAGQQVEQRLHPSGVRRPLDRGERRVEDRRTRASRSASAMTSGGDSVSTLPWPTLNDESAREALVHHALGLAPRRRAVGA